MKALLLLSLFLVVSTYCVSVKDPPNDNSGPDIKIPSHLVVTYQEGSECSTDLEGQDNCEEFRSGEIHIDVDPNSETDNIFYSFNTTTNIILAPESVTGVVAGPWIERFPGYPKGHYYVSALVKTFTPKTEGIQMWAPEGKSFRMYLTRGSNSYKWTEYQLVGVFPKKEERNPQAKTEL